MTTTTYTLSAEEVGTELRDVSEFSTVLNATARYERADVGLAVCLGYRDEALEEARTLLRTHRRNLSEGLEWVKTEGVEQAEHLQWFDAGTRIRETIVGIIAGMALGAEGYDATSRSSRSPRRTTKSSKCPGGGVGSSSATGWISLS
ncbi:hypothetical protein SY89_01025 [Halolamina pelagica]|uniref:Uncharacterized protein n=1 Tax=Halolamina pelagica TaxID=699431 RepID=A0A0P7I0U0_9EURY|nr:hypothetical protein SY89_01025 [Halolamina pelagica]